MKNSNTLTLNALSLQEDPLNPEPLNYIGLHLNISKLVVINKTLANLLKTIQCSNFGRPGQKIFRNLIFRFKGLTCTYTSMTDGYYNFTKYLSPGPPGP